MKTIAGSIQRLPAERDPTPSRAAHPGRPRTTSGAAAVKRAEPRAVDHAGYVGYLFERYRPALMRYVSGLIARRADAEDVVQETYARLIEATHLERVDGRARAYMFKIATHLAYDRFRRPQERPIDEANDIEIGDDDASPEAIAAMADGLEILGRTLLQLKPRCRRVFLLRATEGLSYEAIAEALGVSKRTVEREMKHALDTCQRRLGRIE